jgi:adenine nucleotide transporter 17
MIKKIFKEEGFGGFYKGIVPSLILTLNPVILFTTYEFLRKSFLDIKGNISNKNILIISVISKVFTILINYPLMTIKSLYQANSNTSSEDVWKILLKLIKEESIFSLYKGLSSKLVGSLISNTVLMVTYEKIQYLAKILLAELIFGIKPYIHN